MSSYYTEVPINDLSFLQASDYFFHWRNLYWIQFGETVAICPAVAGKIPPMWYLKRNTWTCMAHLVPTRYRDQREGAGFKRRLGTHNGHP